MNHLHCLHIFDATFCFKLCLIILIGEINRAAVACRAATDRAIFNFCGLRGRPDCAAVLVRTASEAVGISWVSAEGAVFDREILLR